MNDKMIQFAIVDFPDSLRQKLKFRALEKQITLKQLVIEALEREVKKQ